MKPIVAAYYPDWVEEVPPRLIPYSRLTHLVHAFAEVRPDGTLRLPPEKQATELVERARAAKVEPLLAVGGAESGDGFRAATSHRARILTFARKLAEAAERLGYAGIDLDWEFARSDADRKTLTTLAAALRRRLPSARLTMAVSAGDWYGRWIDADGLRPLIDWWHVMTYDFAGPWSAEAGHNAPLPAVAASIDYWTGTRRWPKDKFVLGLPSYGRGFRASAWGEKTTGSYERSYVGYREIQRLKGADWTERRDEAAGVPYLEKRGGGELLSFEDAASARAKGALARERGLRGVFFWEITQDLPDHPLLDAARAGLLG